MKKNYEFQKGEKLIISEKNKIHQIEISEIEIIYTESGISTIKKRDKSSISVSKNLSYFDKELADLEFERANRNEIINCAFITDFNIKQRELKLSNNIVKISHRNLKKFTKIFSNNDTLN